MDLSLFKEVVLTGEEAQFLQEVGRLPYRAERLKSPELEMKVQFHQSRIMSEMYFVKHLERTVHEVINSNKELAKSNERHAKAMRWLTGALVVAAFVQIIIAVI